MLDSSSKIVVISNTGPLISAFQCGRIDLLKHYFETIYIPESELEEFRRHGADETTRQLISEGFVIVKRLTADEKARARQIARSIAESTFARVRDYEHHLPEAEAMALMDRKEMNVARILLEEKAARETAKSLGLPLTGFIGVLLRACRDSLLTPDEMRALLADCRRQGTRYSDELIAEMYHRCQEVRQE